MIALKDLDKYMCANAVLISWALQHQAASDSLGNTFPGTKEGSLQSATNQAAMEKLNPQKAEAERKKQDHFQSKCNSKQLVDKLDGVIRLPSENTIHTHAVEVEQPSNPN